MSLIISKGLTIHNGVSVGTPSAGHGEIVATDNYTILNFIWRVKTAFESMQGFLSSYDFTRYDGSSWKITRESYYALVYLRPNGFIHFKYDGNKYLEYIYNPDEETIAGLKKECLIDAIVNTYEDGYKQITVINDNIGKTYYKSNEYYQNIILLMLNN